MIPSGLVPTIFALTVSLISQTSLANPNWATKLFTKESAIPQGAFASEPVTFEVQEGTTSLLIKVTGSRDSAYVITSMHKPSGNEFKFNSRSNLRLNSVAYYPGYATALMIPEKNKSSIAAGTWKLTVKTYEKTQNIDLLKIQIVENRLIPKQTYKLNLNLYLTNSFGLTKNNYASSNVGKGIVDLQAIFSKYGIEIKVNEINDYAIKSQSIEIDSDRKSFRLEELINVPEAKKENLNVFFIEEINQGGAQGGSPGAPGVFIDNPRSGAIVASNKEDSLARLKPMGLLLAHEIGHFLGLRHPYEIGGPMPRAVVPYNIMNPDTFADLDNSKFSFTPEQIRVIKNHPLLN